MNPVLITLSVAGLLVAIVLWPVGTIVVFALCVFVGGVIKR